MNKIKTFETDEYTKIGKIKFDVINGTKKLVLMGKEVVYYLADTEGIISIDLWQMKISNEERNMLKEYFSEKIENYDGRLFVSDKDYMEIKENYYFDAEAAKEKEIRDEMNKKEEEKRRKALAKLQKEKDKLYTKEEQAKMNRTAMSMLEGDSEDDVEY